jgi:hypothetical protein
MKFCYELGKTFTEAHEILKNIYGDQCMSQRDRTFKGRYREHIQATRTNRPTSKYALHILDTAHA